MEWLRLICSKPAGQKHDIERLTLLDATRGLAAIAVLVFHYRNFFQTAVGIDDPSVIRQAPAQSLLLPVYEYGNKAVPYFWMISGFVFAAVYLDRKSSTSSFFINRFARLYPLHLLTLLIVACLQFIALRKTGSWTIFGNNDAYHFMLQLFMVSSWGFEDGPSYNVPIWSVSVEIVIYAIFWMVHRQLDRFGIIGPLAMSAICAPLTYVPAVNLIAKCGFHFFIGCSALIATRHLSGQRLQLWAILAALATLGLMGVLSKLSFLAYFIGWPALFSATIMLVSLIEGKMPSRWRPCASMIGDTTYGVYLLHFPIQLLIVLILGGITHLLAQSMYFFFAYLVITIMSARISYLYFERPLRDLVRKRLNSTFNLPLT